MTSTPLALPPTPVPSDYLIAPLQIQGDRLTRHFEAGANWIVFRVSTL
ncbi:hypothetical protein [Nostoc sp. T09]|nr:hypothetical protein [Nostoc sp. T09]